MLFVAKLESWWIKWLEFFYKRLKTSGKVLFDKLALECEDEILNTTETLHDNKAAICGSNCHFQTISLVIICTLLLASVSIGCYYSYTNKNIF